MIIYSCQRVFLLFFTYLQYLFEFILFPIFEVILLNSLSYTIQMNQQTIEREDRDYTPINCCSQGVTISQVLAIGLFIGIQIIGFNLIPQMLHLQSAVMHALMVLSLVTLIVLAIEYIRLSKSDPSDPHLYDKDYHMPEALEKRCDICQSMVSVTSYHCQSCDRCAEGFDHHCIFVNNCVGKTNYSTFIRLLIAIILHTSTNLGIFIWLFLTLKDSYKWLALSFGVLNLVVFIEVTILAIFHSYISFFLYKTTLQWIKGDQDDAQSAKPESVENTHVELIKATKCPQIAENK